MYALHCTTSLAKRGSQVEGQLFSWVSLTIEETVRARTRNLLELVFIRVSLELAS